MNIKYLEHRWQHKIGQVKNKKSLKKQKQNRRPPFGVRARCSGWDVRKVRLYVKAAAVTPYLLSSANMAGDVESLESCLSKFLSKKFFWAEVDETRSVWVVRLNSVGARSAGCVHVTSQWEQVSSSCVGQLLSTKGCQTGLFFLLIKLFLFLLNKLFIFLDGNNKWFCSRRPWLLIQTAAFNSKKQTILGTCPGAVEESTTHLNR